MNKNALAAALLLTLSPLALATTANHTLKPASSAASSAPAAPAKVKKSSRAEDAVVSKFIDLQDAAIKTFLELGDTLRDVKDKESADAAAPTIKLAGEQLCLIITQVEALGEPSDAAQQAIMQRIANVAEKNRIVEQVMVPMLTLMMQTPPCHGSDALHTELSNLLANLQGAAGMEEADEGEEGTEVEIVPLQEPN